MDSKPIWPEKKDFFDSVLKNSKFSALFEDDEQKEFYLPGKRPNGIHKDIWENLVRENPNLKNKDIPIAISKQGEIVCLESETPCGR